MFKTAKRISCLVLFCFILSCQNEPSNLQNSATKSFINGTVINGRFYFSSRENLKSDLENFKKKNTKDLEDQFEKIYEKGFLSNTPIVDPKNEILISKLSNKKKELQKSNDAHETPEEDSTIPDPYFAAVINQNNEIIVGDSIYKITKDLGVLSIHISDTTYLKNYLKEHYNFKSSLKTKKGALTDFDPCTSRSQYGGNTNLDSKISRFIAPIDIDCRSIQIPFPNPSILTSIPQLTEDQIVQNQINNLPICDGLHDTSWFQSLFGTNRSCINYFDNSHRIKTEFWNQSWGIYSSIGVQTRVQVKRFGIWFKSEADELHLGINRVLLKYNYPDPKINTYNPFTTESLPPIYMYNNYYQVLGDGNNFKLVNITSGTGLPFFKFNNNNILNIYIRQLPNPYYQINSESNIKQLYNLGINFLKKAINSDPKKEFVITHQKNANEIEVLYFGERYKALNTNKIERKFDSQILEFLITYSNNLNYSTPTSVNPTGATGSNSFSLKIAKGQSFRNYTYYELDFYALGRRRDIWSGNRMNKI